MGSLRCDNNARVSVSGIGFAFAVRNLETGAWFAFKQGWSLGHGTSGIGSGRSVGDIGVNRRILVVEGQRDTAKDADGLIQKEEDLRTWSSRL